MAEQSAPANHADSPDADICYATLVASDSETEHDVGILEVCMGVLVDSADEGDTALPPDPPLARTGTHSWAHVTPCSKPIRRLADARAQCRWSERSCPWLHHAVWRVEQGRDVVTLQPCPSHPRCLYQLCRTCLRSTGTGSSQ